MPAVKFFASLVANEDIHFSKKARVEMISLFIDKSASFHRRINKKRFDTAFQSLNWRRPFFSTAYAVTVNQASFPGRDYRRDYPCLVNLIYNILFFAFPRRKK